MTSNRIIFLPRKTCLAEVTVGTDLVVVYIQQSQPFDDSNPIGFLFVPFWTTSSVLEGSSFRSLLTSFSPDCVTAMEMSNYNFTDTQKESCAVSLMRDTVKELALRDTISCEDALLRFTNSKVYETLFDYDTGIWRESPDYLLNLYDYCNSKKTA